MTLCQTLVGSFDSEDARYSPWFSRRGDAATFASIATTGTWTVRQTNQKDFVRFQHTTIPLAGNTAWVHFRMLPPEWKSERRVRR